MNRRPQHQQQQGNKNSQRPRRKRRGDGSQRPDPTVEVVSRQAAPVLRTYQVVFYDTHAQAREDAPKLAELKAACDQLNIVIRAEGGMDDPQLLSYGKIYAGEAWTLIHKRRVDDGWYLEPRE